MLMNHLYFYRQGIPWHIFPVRQPSGVSLTSNDEDVLKKNKWY